MRAKISTVPKHIALPRAPIIASLAAAASGRASPHATHDSSHLVAATQRSACVVRQSVVQMSTQPARQAVESPKKHADSHATKRPPTPSPSRRGATYTSPPRDGTISPPVAASRPARLFNTLLNRAEARPPAPRPEPFHLLPRDDGDDHLRASFEQSLVRDGLTVSALFQIKTRGQPRKKGQRARGRLNRARDACAAAADAAHRYFESLPVEFENGNRFDENVDSLQIKKRFSDGASASHHPVAIHVKRRPKTPPPPPLTRPSTPPVSQMPSPLHFNDDDVADADGKHNADSSWEAGKDVSDSDDDDVVEEEEDNEILPVVASPRNERMITRRRSRARMMQDEQSYDIIERPTRRRRSTLQKTTPKSKSKQLYKPYKQISRKTKSETTIHKKRARSFLLRPTHQVDQPPCVDLSVAAKSKPPPPKLQSADDSPEIEVVEVATCHQSPKQDSRNSPFKPFLVYKSPSARRACPPTNESIVYLDEQRMNQKAAKKSSSSSQRLVELKSSLHAGNSPKQSGKHTSEKRLSLSTSDDKRDGVSSARARRHASLPDIGSAHSARKRSDSSCKRKPPPNVRESLRPPFVKISPLHASLSSEQVDSTRSDDGNERAKEEDDGSDIIEVAVLKISPQRKKVLERLQDRKKLRKNGRSLVLTKDGAAEMEAKGGRKGKSGVMTRKSGYRQSSSLSSSIEHVGEEGKAGTMVSGVDVSSERNVMKSQTVFTRGGSNRKGSSKFCGGVSSNECGKAHRPMKAKNSSAKSAYRTTGGRKKQVIDLSAEESKTNEGQVINVLSDEDCELIEVAGGSKATDSSCSKQ